MSRYPSSDVARFDQQFAQSPAERIADRREAILQRRIRELEAALQPYTHCRHACIECSCTKEAKAALHPNGSCSGGQS